MCILKCFLLPLAFALLGFSCDTEKPQAKEAGAPPCLYAPPEAIFDMPSLVSHHSFKAQGQSSLEKITFKKSMNLPFVSLSVRQEGCSGIEQHFVFEGGGGVAENFSALCSLHEKYIAYCFLAKKLETISPFPLGDTIEVSESFYIWAEQTNTGLKVSMSSDKVF